jgi:hypothetical protein
MMDPKVACWLTDPDNPPTSFKEALTKCGMGQHESGCLDDDLKQLSSIMHVLYRRLSSEGQWSLFLKLEMRLLPILSLMELRGIKIKTETLVKFGDLLKVGNHFSYEMRPRNTFLSGFFCLVVSMMCVT